MIIGLVGMAGGTAASRNRGGVWAVLIALLLGGVIAASAPPMWPADGHPVLTAAGTPWGSANLPDPQARKSDSLATAAIPARRIKPSSSPWPKTDAAALVASLCRRPDSRHGAVRRRPRGTIAGPSPLRLAYDPHGPPLLTR